VFILIGTESALIDRTDEYAPYPTPFLAIALNYILSPLANGVEDVSV